MSMMMIVGEAVVRSCQTGEEEMCVFVHRYVCELLLIYLTRVLL